MSEQWAAIVRVSHMGERQAGSDSFHADRDQVEAVRRYASARGADVEFLAPELSVSGGLPIEERPSLLAAIEGVEAGRYTGIVVAYLSRLTRSRSGLEIWERVEAAGGHVHCAAEDLDTSTPNGRFIRDIHLANAVREREEHADRFEQRRRTATEAGIWQRRQVPLGYRRDEQTRRLAIDEQAARLVRDLFARRAAGVSISELARQAQMTGSGVRYLLANRVYLGELRVGEHVNPAAHPPLVAPDVWQSAQRSSPPRPGRGDGPALLAGLVRCCGCGHTMSRQRAGGGRVSYACRGHHSAGKCPAPAGITARIVEEAVSFTALVELGRLRIVATAAGGDVPAAREDVARARAELEQYVQTVSAAGLGGDAFAEGARTRQAAVLEAERRLEALLDRQPISVDGDPIEAWRRMGDSERNHVLRGVIECVLVRRVGRGGRVVPVGERVRIVRRGAGVVAPYGGGGAAHPIRQIDFDDLDDDVLLRVLGREDLT